MCGIKHFWTPPENESILGMTKFRDMIVIATTRGVWMVTDKDTLLDDLVVRRVEEK